MSSPRALLDAMARVIRGKDEAIESAVVCLVAEGHLLLEDLPGLGKTMLARSLSTAISGTFRRIQFTPDLLPSDLTGVTVYRQAQESFEFHPGPIFGNIVLADEINRASPKTQAALLEVMEERRVTVDGTSYAVPRPFMVVATQNPIELEGTYRLPEAQLDRFLMKISMGYPEHESEMELLRSQGGESTLSHLQPVISSTEVQGLVNRANDVYVAEAVFEYLLRVCQTTRKLPELRFGVSPRGVLALARACRALAVVQEREFVTPDDVKRLAVPVLAHRVLLAPEAELHGQTGESVILSALAAVPVPKASRS